MVARLNKKSQITIFMIIGIILLFSTALVMYIRAQVVEAEVRQFQPVVEEVPLQAKPIKAYVEQCVYDLGLEAVQIIGAQGGWISFTDEDLNGGEYFTESPLPAEGDLIKGIGPQKTTYWNYMSSSNTQLTGSRCGGRIPPLESPTMEGAERALTDTSIEAQIDRYIKSNLDGCLDGFRPFRSQGIEMETLEDPVITTVVTEKDIAINLYYPMEMTTPTSKTELNIFNALIDLNLRKIYSMAFGIATADRSTKFLAYNAMAFFTIFMGKDSNKLPPMSDNPSIMSYEYPIWVINNLKKDFQNKYIPHLAQRTSILGTKNFQFRKVEGNRALQEMAQGQELIHVANIDSFLSESYNYNNTNVDFLYFGQPIYLNILPGNGVIVTPVQDNVDMKFFQMTITKYGFDYYMAFPYIVLVDEPDALNGRGYQFQFAVEVNIRGNAPFNCSTDTLFLSRTSDRDMFQERNQWISGNVTIETVDAITEEPLPDVQIKFSCGDLATTVIGGTELQLVEDPASGAQVEKAILETRFPLCYYGGLLELYTPGYLGAVIPFNTRALENTPYLLFTLEEEGAQQ